MSRGSSCPFPAPQVSVPFRQEDERQTSNFSVPESPGFEYSNVRSPASRLVDGRSTVRRCFRLHIIKGYVQDRSSNTARRLGPLEYAAWSDEMKAILVANILGPRLGL
jgi:hypothetical protein